MLAIEIDGENHCGQEKYDEARQHRLENFGIRFLRFEDAEIIYNLEQVLKKIESGLRKIKRNINPSAAG